MSNNGRSWYDTGYAGAEKEQERRDLGSAPPRFWLKPGASKEIVWVTDDPFCYYEHQWRVGDDKQFYYGTCVSKINPDGCYLDSAKGVGRAEYVGQYTIVDVSGYVTKEGKENKFQLMLLPAKTKVLNRLKKKKENKGTLIGQLWSVARGDDHSPNTGDDFDFIREAKMDELYKVVTYKGKKLAELIAAANGSGVEAAKVRKYLCHHFDLPTDGPIPEVIPRFNYANLFKPMDEAEMRAASAGAHSFGSGGGSSAGTGASSSSADDVPF